MTAATKYQNQGIAQGGVSCEDAEDWLTEKLVAQVNVSEDELRQQYTANSSSVIPLDYYNPYAIHLRECRSPAHPRK